ncbi:MAG: M16 family metallopeptidase [Caulobacterales bacterium]|jgi:predicted Zn-dependent peptidase
METLTLPNKVRVALDPMPALETAAVGVWVRVGARWESAAQNGVAHLFEHMAFKGAGGRDARQFAEAAESVGASLNASTGYETTAYFARCAAEDATFALGLVADIVRVPHWEIAELEKEKGVVAQEIGEAFDQPSDRVFELLQAATFPDQPLGRPILGDVETLKGIGVPTLEAFRNTHMTGPHVVIAAAGRYDRDAILELAQTRFGDLTSEPGPAPQAAAIRDGLKVEARRTEQTHLALSWAGAPAAAAQAYPLRVLAEILGGGMSSRLFQEVREKRGLVYAIDAFTDAYEDAGRFAVYAGCGPKQAKEVVKLTVAALEDLAATGPTEAELQRAKATLSAQMLMGAEQPMARADLRAAQLFLRGELFSLADIRARFRAVTAQDVQAVAQAALAGPRAAAAVGPKGGLVAAEAFAARIV